MMMHTQKNRIAFVIGTCLLLISGAHAVDTKKVTCVTGKETYEQGEEVVVTVTNHSSEEMSIVDRKYIDGGFAIIERKDNDGAWHSIELYAAANIATFRTLRKGESHGYLWRTVGYNRIDTAAAAGAYRILFHNGIISNPFFIRDRTHPP